MKSLGIKGFLSKQFATYKLPEVWVQAIGEISDPFTWLVFGKPKNGKTSFLLQFCKAMCLSGVKVYYNSMEEGASKTMQDAFIRLDMASIPDGLFTLGDRDTFSEMVEKLKKNRAKVCIIDSRDYMKLTTDQWKRLTTTFPKKSFVLVCWEQSGKPLGKYAKDIEFMVSMVTHVRNFKALTNGRFGAGLQFTIWNNQRTSPGELNFNAN